MVRVILLLGVTCVGVASGRAARADVVPPGDRAIPHEVSLVVAPALRDRCAFEVVIRAGDTLSGLAQQHLGKAARWQELVALNPGTDPARLVPGRSLLVPPRTREADLPHYHLFVLSHHLNAFAEGPAYLEWGGPPPAAEGDFVVAAVQEEHLAAFQQRIRDQRERVQFLMDVREGRESCDWLALSDDLGVDSSVRSSSPIQRMRTEFEVQGLEGSHLEVRVKERQRFDADGDEMSAWEATVRSRIFLAGLGASGFVGLVLLALFRRKG